MKIYAVYIFDVDNIIYQYHQLDEFNYFIRKNIKEFCMFISKIINDNTNINEAKLIEETNEFFKGNLYNKKFSDIGYVMITDNDYPKHLMIQLINEINFIYKNKNSNIDGLIRKYQNPEELDKIIKIKNEIDEAKKVAIMNIDKILIRGQNLDEIVEKTENLSKQSKDFYTQSKKLNKCCNIYLN